MDIENAKLMENPGKINKSYNLNSIRYLRAFIVYLEINGDGHLHQIHSSSSPKKYEQIMN